MIINTLQTFCLTNFNIVFAIYLVGFPFYFNPVKLRIEYIPFGFAKIFIRLPSKYSVRLISMFFC